MLLIFGIEFKMLLFAKRSAFANKNIFKHLKQIFANPVFKLLYQFFHLFQFIYFIYRFILSPS